MNVQNKPAVYLLIEEIKKLETEIDWLNKKNIDHQELINGNNENIKKLNSYIFSMQLDLMLINSNNENTKMP